MRGEIFSFFFSKHLFQIAILFDNNFMEIYRFARSPVIRTYAARYNFHVVYHERRMFYARSV